jgi:hypothetical protein
MKTGGEKIISLFRKKGIIINKKCIYLIYFLLLFSTACEDKKNQIPTGENIIPSEEITLETCDENINDNIPSFFMKYFKCVDIELTDNQVVIPTLMRRDAIGCYNNLIVG